MNALIGSVKVFPIKNNSMIWYEYQDTGVSTDAHLIAQDGEFLLITSGWETKIIHVSKVTRIVSPRVAESEELHLEEMMQYEAEERE